MLDSVPLHPLVAGFNEIDGIRVGPGMNLGLRKGAQQAFIVLGATFPPDTGPPTGSDLKAKTTAGTGLLKTEEGQTKGMGSGEIPQFFLRRMF
jgi:hypothetical protein